MRLYPIDPRSASVPEPGDWEFRHSDRPCHDDPPSPEVDWSPREVVAVLYGSDGEVLRAWTDRPPVGYQPR